MKRDIQKIIKAHGGIVEEYSSERSDMGTQSFTVVFRLDGKSHRHVDGYFVGEFGGREKVLDYLTDTIRTMKNPL